MRSTARSPTRVTGFDALDQTALDTAMIELDGTENKERLGANAILAVSLAAAKAAAVGAGLPLYRYLGGVGARVLPTPMMNIINGGAHADNPLDIQEFMILPVGAETFTEALRAGRRGLPRAEEAAQGRRPQHRVGDEGGFAPNVNSRAGAGLHREGVEAAGYKLGEDIVLGLDVASSEFFKDGTYQLEGEGKTLDPAGMVRLARGPVRAVPDRLDRGRHGRGRLGRLEAADRDAGRRRSSSSATTCSSPTPRSWPRASRKGSPTRS